MSCRARAREVQSRPLKRTLFVSHRARAREGVKSTEHQRRSTSSRAREAKPLSQLNGLEMSSRARKGQVINSLKRINMSCRVREGINSDVGISGLMSSCAREVTP